MLVSFDSLPDHSRLWIYQSPRKFSSAEVSTISDALTSFISHWSAHGSPLTASFKILYDQFVLLAVDEETHSASGCSIDDSTRTIREISARIGIDLFDRSRVSFLADASVVTFPVTEIKKAYQEGKWSKRTLVVNALASSKAELKNGLLVPAELTWLKRYLPNEKVAG